jgi:hypothetical protein
MTEYGSGRGRGKGRAGGRGMRSVNVRRRRGDTTILSTPKMRSCRADPTMSGRSPVTDVIPTWRRTRVNPRCVAHTWCVLRTPAVCRGYGRGRGRDRAERGEERRSRVVVQRGRLPASRARPGRVGGRGSGGVRNECKLQ